MSGARPGLDAALVDYDWAVLRAVPDVCSGAFVPLGVVLHARRARVLGLRLSAAAVPGLDATLLDCAREGLRRIARGDADAGPVALLPPSERFHWLVAVRSAAVQSSPVHTGRAADPEAALDRIYASVVRGTTDGAPP